MLGAWTLTGTGNSEGQWSATFELKKTDNEYAGTESFRGTSDSAKQEIVHRGVAAKGQVEKARYVANVSADGKQMTNGKRTGTSDGSEANPRLWEAHRTGDDKPRFEKKFFTDATQNALSSAPKGQQ